jgi:hypothetical protein
MKNGYGFTTIASCLCWIDESYSFPAARLPMSFSLPTPPAPLLLCSSAPLLPQWVILEWEASKREAIALLLIHH